MTLQQVPSFDTRARQFETAVRHYLPELKEFDYKRLTEFFNNYQEVVVKEIVKVKEVVKLVEVEKGDTLKVIQLENILEMVCEMLDIEPEKTKTASRKREFVQARQITMYLATKYTKCSLKTIGAYFGGRDHTTAIHSIQTVKDLMETDPWYRSVVDSLVVKLEG